jgi:hypothetical protein
MRQIKGIGKRIKGMARSKKRESKKTKIKGKMVKTATHQSPGVVVLTLQLVPC